MAEDRVIFSIAGLPLQVEGQSIEALPDVFKKFLAAPKRGPKNIPRLDAAHFFLKAPSGRVKKEFNDKLLSYVYSQMIAMNRGLLLHATAVLKGKKAFLFFGPSGGGKSTVAALSRDHEVIGDDVVAARKCGAAFYAFSTPWRQSGFVRTHTRAKGKVRAVFFLKKSKRIRFEPLSKEEALARIVSRHIHFFTYTEMPLAGKVFDTAVEFVKSFPAYEMEFVKDKSFWPALENIYER
jgi:hypothetical protein